MSVAAYEMSSWIYHAKRVCYDSMCLISGGTHIRKGRGYSSSRLQV